MLPGNRKEQIESIVVTVVLSVVIALAQTLIKDSRISSIVIGISAVSIILVLVLPYIRRYLYSYITLWTMKRFQERSTLYHLIVHQARDICIRMLEAAPSYNAPAIIDGCSPMPHPQLEKNRDQIISLLQKVAELFQKLAPPGTRVWTCLRDYRSDDNFHTFARAGIYNPHREQHSKPLPRESRVLRRLIDSCSVGRCVLITGSSKGPQVWEYQNNDIFGEDKTVLLGAVFTKSWNVDRQDLSNMDFVWILGVCANSENAFDEIHISLMQSCVDIFSILANMIIRYRQKAY